MANGYQAGGTPATALVGSYCSPLDERMARLFRRYAQLSGRQKRIVDAAVPDLPREQWGETYAISFGHAIRVAQTQFLPT